MVKVKELQYKITESSNPNEVCIEVIEEVKKSLATEFLLDAIVRAENVQVSEAELTEYLIRSSTRYGMAPEQFVQEIRILAK